MKTLVRAFGGEEQTRPSPVERGKTGTKHTISVDRHGVPLAIHTAGATASDHAQIIPLVLESPQVGSNTRRPKSLPDDLYADTGYDSDNTRWLSINPQIGKRKRTHSSGLGNFRCVVERTIDWLERLRRLCICCDRLAVSQQAWNTLAACVSCFRLLHDDIAFAA